MISLRDDTEIKAVSSTERPESRPDPRSTLRTDEDGWPKTLVEMPFSVIPSDFAALEGLAKIF
jgi:hypothetical protein